MSKEDTMGLRAWRAVDAVLLAALAAFAYKLTFVAGERGFFPYDQGHVFDGGYRILSGQVPYKDFLLYYTPLVYVLQALFFKFLGVSYFAYLFAAACVNAAAALASLAIVRLLFPGRRALSYAGGFLTAVWFYPPFGTPNMERMAFFCALLVLAGVLAALVLFPPGSKVREISSLVSGIGLALTFLSKQNVAPMFLPLVLALWVAGSWPDWKRGLKLCAGALAGSLLGFALFFLWLWAQSDVGNFIEHSLRIPMQYGAQRAAEKSAGGFFQVLALGWFVPWKEASIYMPSLTDIDTWIRLLVSFAFAMAVWTLCRLRRPGSVGGARRALAAVLCLGLIYLQYLFIATTANIWMNGLLALGLILAIGFGLAFELVPERETLALGWLSRTLRTGAAVCLLLSTAYLGAMGIRVSLSRELHDELFLHAEFPRYLPIRGLEALKWGEPTWLLDYYLPGGGVREALRAWVHEADILALEEYLRSLRGNFFVFPDFTLFYGVLGTRSPQPLIKFVKGGSYPRRYDRSLDEWIVRDLERADIRAVVLEKFSFKHTSLILDDFPLLRSYIEEGFEPVGDIGIFRIYERRG